MVAPRGQRAAPLSKTPSPQTERQLLLLCIAGCWLARQQLVFALLVVTEGFLGKASATKLFFFPGGRSGEQSGRGRSGWGTGGGQGRTHAVERQRLSSGGVPGAPGSGAAAAAAPIPTPGTCCTAATAPGDISQHEPGKWQHQPCRRGRVGPSRPPSLRPTPQEMHTWLGRRKRI